MQEPIPYKSAKPMFLVEYIENQDILKNIVIDTCKDLPIKKN